MTVSIQQALESDCSVLLFRALYKRPILAFGEDGLGKHGSCNNAQHYTICNLEVFVEIDSEDLPSGELHIILTGYDSDDFGHICTDQNFMIDLRKRLSFELLNPDCLSYASIKKQGKDRVVMDINVLALMDYS